MRLHIDNFIEFNKDLSYLLSDFIKFLGSIEERVFTSIIIVVFIQLYLGNNQ